MKLILRVWRKIKLVVHAQFNFHDLVHVVVVALAMLLWKFLWRRRHAFSNIATAIGRRASVVWEQKHISLSLILPYVCWKLKHILILVSEKESAQFLLRRVKLKSKLGLAIVWSACLATVQFVVRHPPQLVGHGKNNFKFCKFCLLSNS